MMRKITRAEADQWTELAQAHGHVSAAGQIALGRYVVDSFEGSMMTLRFVTPVPAGLYSEGDLRRKAPPILFDRQSDGTIVLPGRWWQFMLERVSKSEQVPADLREKAAAIARSLDASDVLLPADTDTIDFLAPDTDGALVPHEALAPGTTIRVRMRTMK